MSAVDKAKTLSREMNAEATHAVERATLADRERRDYGIAPHPAVLDCCPYHRTGGQPGLSCGGDRFDPKLEADPFKPFGYVQDARTLPAFAALGRSKAIAAAVEAERAIVRQRISSERTCKACGGGAAYLETRPDLDYCTPECGAHGPAIKKHITSALEIDLGAPLPAEECRRIQEQYRREHEGMSAREAMASVEQAFAGYAQLRGEDAAASAMFDGDAPHEDEPVVDHAEELRRVTLERDEAVSLLDGAIDVNRQLQQQLDAALAMIEALREGGV